MRGQIRGKNKPKLIDLRYGFYVAMGGFVYNVEGLYDYIPLATLTPRGIIALASQGHFVDINPEDILDKSKADIFTKGLICIQVSWMVIQCIARKAAGYPLTLLEIHTMVHVVCALTLYVLWWKKPYDIIEATVIYAADYDNYRPIVAIMLLGSYLDGHALSEAWCLQFKDQMNPSNDDNGLALSGRETSVANKDETTIQVSDGPVSESSSSSELSSVLDQEAINAKPTVCTLLANQYLPCAVGPRNRWAPRNLTSTDIRRWELCASVIIEFAKTNSRKYEYGLAKIEIDDLEYFLRRLGFTTTFLINIPNFWIDGIMDRWPSYMVYTSVLLESRHLLLYLLRFFVPLTAAYGGIHLSAWNFEFPSRVESVIWRTACFIIMGSSFALLTIPSWEALGAYFEYPYQGPDWEIRRGSKLMGFKFIKALTKTAGYGFASLLLLCYAASRIYLVVESFISLRHVPIGVYAAVPSVENIPHV